MKDMDHDMDHMKTPEIVDIDDHVLHPDYVQNEEYGGLRQKKVRKFFTR